MTSSEIIEACAADAYRHGVDPVSFALAVLEVVTEETLHLPCCDPHVKLLSRRLVGAMMDCGWTMPVPRRPE